MLLEIHVDPEVVLKTILIVTENIKMHFSVKACYLDYV